MAETPTPQEVERLISAAAEPALDSAVRDRLQVALRDAARPARRGWVLALAAALALAGGLVLWFGVGPRATPPSRVAEGAAPLLEPKVVHVRADPFLKSTRVPGLDISRWEAR